MKPFITIGRWLLAAEVLASVALLLILPDQIPLPFSFLLTSGATFGSKWNLLALPVTAGIVLLVWRACQRSTLLPQWLNWLARLLGSLVLAGTVYYLLVVGLQLL